MRGKITFFYLSAGCQRAKRYPVPECGPKSFRIRPESSAFVAQKERECGPSGSVQAENGGVRAEKDCVKVEKMGCSGFQSRFQNDAVNGRRMQKISKRPASMRKLQVHLAMGDRAEKSDSGLKS